MVAAGGCRGCAAAPPAERLVVGLASSPATLLAPFARLEDEVAASLPITAYLLNVELRRELVHVPAIAERWEASPDGLSITLFLKEARWSDGEPVTAADVVFTYRVIADPRFASPSHDAVSRMREKDPVEALDARTVRFHFRAPYYLQNQLSDANVGLLARHAYATLKPEDARGTPGALQPVGHGPFKVARRDAQVGWILERDERVVSTRVPELKQVVLVPFASYDARLHALKAGEIDVLDGLRLDDAAAIRATGEFELIDRGRRFVDFVLWNGKRPLFADRDVRRALTLAIDRDGMNAVLLGAYGERAVGTVPPLLADASARDVAPLPHDPKEAARLLDAAGWRLGADGIRAKDGRRFAFTLLVNHETARRMQTAVMAQQDLRKIGVDAKVEPMSMSALNELVTSGRYDASIYGLVASLQLKATDVWSSGGSFNFAGYSNAEVDRLTAAQRDETDYSRLCANLREMQRLVHDDQPVTFLCWFSRLTAVRSRFRDLGADALSLLGRLEGCSVRRE